ncbi:aspartokinase 2, chloroplastic-like isoform X2 [Oryza glaberrima]|uniref:aspartokinase 2, chloroplastic-like isoform X2 n=1 Tax=Oryza glaberrima TaxID=4538 RepID=UPI00224C48CE|nr:aspartokinase 2, chloroplastic-like isoform X2 [Oryza glaberrima]
MAAAAALRCNPRPSAAVALRGAAAAPQVGNEAAFELLVGATEPCLRGRRRGAGIRCQRSAAASAVVVEKKGRAVEPAREGANAGHTESELTVVMKFGGSSVALAERMREVADLILSFPEERPVIVLSAMGKTTNKLLMAGEKAVGCGATNVSELDELTFIKELHFGTIDQLGLDRSIVSGLSDELEQLLKGIAMMKELTLRTRDYLVSFGECMSTRIFAALLNKLGVKARQYDAFEIGFITTDDFTNADILEATYPAIAKRLHGDWVTGPAIPIVTGFLGKGWKTGAITTLGRGGSDLTATTIGKALGLREIQVWKDVDGVLTCDPNIHPNAKPVPYLTFDEAAELAYFGAQVLHPQSMRPAREGDIPVRVKNSYNRGAPGTLITKARDMSKTVLTSIVLKSNITMLDIVSTRMLGQYGFLAKVFSIFEDLGISVDCVATSEVSISLTLDPSKLWSRELIKQELDHVIEELEKIAVVHLLQHRSIISLIGNVQRSSLILEKAFNVLRTNGVNVQMISQGASKVNISLVVHDSEAKQCVQALHSAFFESGFLPEVNDILQDDSVAHSNGTVYRH